MMVPLTLRKSGDVSNFLCIKHENMVYSLAKGLQRCNQFKMLTLFFLWFLYIYIAAGFGSSVGCALDWWSGGREFEAPVPATFFRWDWSWNLFYGHSLPSADSRREVVSYLRKNVHWVLVNRLIGLSLPRKSAVRLTDRPNMTLAVDRGR